MATENIRSLSGSQSGNQGKKILRWAVIVITMICLGIGIRVLLSSQPTEPSIPVSGKYTIENLDFGEKDSDPVLVFSENGMTFKAKQQIAGSSIDVEWFGVRESCQNGLRGACYRAEAKHRDSKTGQIQNWTEWYGFRKESGIWVGDGLAETTLGGSYNRLRLSYVVVSFK